MNVGYSKGWTWRSQRLPELSAVVKSESLHWRVGSRSMVYALYTLVVKWTTGGLQTNDNSYALRNGPVHFPSELIPSIAQARLGCQLSSRVRTIAWNTFTLHPSMHHNFCA
jgi:hypothetical protein